MIKSYNFKSILIAIILLMFSLNIYAYDKYDKFSHKIFKLIISADSSSLFKFFPTFDDVKKKEDDMALNDQIAHYNEGKQNFKLSILDVFDRVAEIKYSNGKFNFIRTDYKVTDSINGIICYDLQIFFEKAFNIYSIKFPCVLLNGRFLIIKDIGFRQVTDSISINKILNTGVFSLVYTYNIPYGPFITYNSSENRIYISMCGNKTSFRLKLPESEKRKILDKIIEINLMSYPECVFFPSDFDMSISTKYQFVINGILYTRKFENPRDSDIKCKKVKELDNLIRNYYSKKPKFIRLCKKVETCMYI